MKKLNQKAFLALVAMGIAGTVANAQFFTDASGNQYRNPPFLITITGATLQQTLFTSQASTNDYIDLDRDGISGSDHGQQRASEQPPAGRHRWRHERLDPELPQHLLPRCRLGERCG